MLFVCCGGLQKRLSDGAYFLYSRMGDVQDGECHRLLYIRELLKLRDSPLVLPGSQAIPVKRARIGGIVSDADLEHSTFILGGSSSDLLYFKLR